MLSLDATNGNAQGNGSASKRLRIAFVTPEFRHRAVLRRRPGELFGPYHCGLGRGGTRDPCFNPGLCWRRHRAQRVSVHRVVRAGTAA